VEENCAMGIEEGTQQRGTGSSKETNQREVKEMNECENETLADPQANSKLEMIQAILNNQSVIFNVRFDKEVTLSMREKDCEKFLIVNCEFYGNTTVKQKHKKRTKK
jgi:hypothetical protein